MSKLLQTLQQRVLFLDGAMGTSLHELNLPLSDYNDLENCSEVLNLTRLDAIQQIHERYFAVGCDAVETNTFGAMPHVLCEFDLQDQVHEINVNAVKAARAAALKYTTKENPKFVVGSIGPGTKLVTLGQITWDQMLESYKAQVRGLLLGGPDVGADMLLIETAQDILQCKIAINACIDVQRELGIWETPDAVPIFVQVTIETTGSMLVGTEISAALIALGQLPIAGIGMNCATGPKEMTEFVRYLGENSRVPVSILPNAGLPVMVDGQTVFPLKPEPFAEALNTFVDQFGVNIVGGCCGTTPEHLKAVVDKIGHRKPGLSRETVAGPAPACTSLYSSVDLKQDTSILVVGERTNANGSRKFKEMLADDDWDGLVSWARQEVKGGAHVLDVCVDYVGRNGAKDMHEVISRYIQQISVPLMLDSTQADVLEAGLKLAGGKCIVNSINLEDGEHRLEEVCPMLARYGASVVALTIDEDPQAGMAKTAERKIEIAKRLYDLCVNKYGVKASDILFDPLTFTIATGNDDDRKLGLETLEGIKLISQAMPECGILLGLSNISFGLKPAARQVLNSVFLSEAIARGLTAAIVHPSKILPKHKVPEEQWQAALWLIFDHRGENRPEGQPEDFDPLIHYIGLFPDDGPAKAVVDKENLTIEETLANHIIDGEKRDLEKNLDKALEKYKPLQIINDHLLAGMKVVGELFGSGQMQLPFVLQSAEVMKQSVAYLEPHMEKADTQSKGKMVLATVKGDVHDIGKNLVDIILTNNGFDVVNIGIKQPLNNIIEALEEHKADAIGMSGLLVKSVAVMQENLEEMNRINVNTPTLLGGAALTRNYAETTLRNLYNGPLYYGKDAFDALDIMNKLAENKQDELNAAIETRVAKRAETDAKIAESKARKAAAAGVAVAPSRSAVARDIKVPQAPFYGHRLIEEVPLDVIYGYINKVALYRGQWGFKKGAQTEEQFNEQIANEADPVFQRLTKQCKEENILQPKVVYGYYPCQSDGNDLIVFDAEDHDKEIERFTFPRQDGKKHYCLADFFKSVDEGEKDILGLSCVTMGSKCSEITKQLFDNNEYTEYLYLHGISVECAEGLAELWHKRMREEMGIDADDAHEVRKLFTQNYRGSRYSFGYPACPDMQHQEQLFRLLQPERIGCVLTENWQIDPEQSTSAIIVHHPEAKYFNV